MTEPDNGWEPITHTAPSGAAGHGRPALSACPRLVASSSPRDGTSILIWDGCTAYVAYAAWTGPNDEPIWFNGDVTVDAEFWQPLPAPPNIIQEERG